MFEQNIPAEIVIFLTMPIHITIARPQISWLMTIVE